MKNTEMLDYLRKAEKAAYDDMMKPRIGEFAYEYHRGKYDAIAHARMELAAGLEHDAETVSNMVDIWTEEIMRWRKWTPWPRRRQDLLALCDTLKTLKEK